MFIEIAVPRSAVSKLRPRRANGTVPVLKLSDQDLRADVSVQVGRQKKTDVPGKGSQAGRVPSYSREGKAFCTIQGFSWFDEAHQHWGGQFALLSLPIQILISSRNTLRDIFRIKFDQMSVLHGPDKLMHKINHHKCPSYSYIQNYIYLPPP